MDCASRTTRSVLYIIDSEAQTIRVFDVDVGSGKLTNGKQFAEKVATDGIRVDIDGNVWFSIGWVIRRRTASTATARAVKSSARSTSPNNVANLVFGGLLTKPAVHLRQHFALCMLCQYPRRGSAIAEVDNGARRLPCLRRRRAFSLTVRHCSLHTHSRRGLPSTSLVEHWAHFSVKLSRTATRTRNFFANSRLRTAPLSRCVINQ